MPRIRRTAMLVALALWAAHLPPASGQGRVPEEVPTPVLVVDDVPLHREPLAPVPSQSRERRLSAPRKASAPVQRLSGHALLECIKRFESGGDYSTDTGNGHRGAYQFTDSAWRANFGDRSPSEVSPAEQDALALNYIGRRGLQPWPTPRRLCL